MTFISTYRVGIPGVHAGQKARPPVGYEARNISRTKPMKLVVKLKPETNAGAGEAASGYA
jgi:hypothetical protein